MCAGGFYRAHFHQHNVGTAFRRLPGRFTAGQSATEDHKPLPVRLTVHHPRL
jgi:hypothetical protein